MKYKLKPYIIDAFQYDGDMIYSDGVPYVPEWAIRALDNGRLFYHGAGDLYIADDEWDIPVDVGEYIGMHPDGELFVCDPKTFENAYEVFNEGGIV